MSELMDPVSDGMETSDATDGIDATDDDLATLLRRREHARPNRLTWVLVTLLILSAGFVGGAFANQKWGASSSGSAAFAGLPAGLPAGFPAGMPTGLSSGVGGGGITAQGLPAGMTVGTVKLVDGQKLYVTDASGATVIVTVPATATVTSQAEIPLSGLSAGDSVVVRGEAAADGSVTATSVAEGALPGGPAGGPATSTTTPTSPTSASTAPSTQGEN